MQQVSPFRLMHTVFIGLLLSVAYGLLSSALLYYIEGQAVAQGFFVAYTTSFKTLISLGLIIGTALVVSQSQHTIPKMIESAFTADQLSQTDYNVYRRRFFSPVRSITFSASFVVVGFVIFSYCQFPLTGLADSIMIVAACTQYALGVYVGRKLCYAGMMLHALLKITVTRNLFKQRELDEINTYVHVVSTLTVVFVYLHINGYHGGPFLYNTVLGESIKPFLVLPAVIATPVLLIFNFYPRAVLRKVYDQSIDLELKTLKAALRSEKLSAYEKRSHLIEMDKMSRDELRHSLQLTLSDLPIGITILIMLLEPIVR